MSHQVFNDSTLGGAKADKSSETTVCPLSFLLQYGSLSRDVAEIVDALPDVGN